MTLPPKDDSKVDKTTESHRLMALDLLTCVCLDLQQHAARSEQADMQFTLRPRISGHDWKQLVAGENARTKEDYTCMQFVWFLCF